MENPCLMMSKDEIKALKRIRASLAYSMDDIRDLIENYSSLDNDEIADKLRDLVHDWSSFNDRPFGDRQNTEIVDSLKILDNFKTKLKNQIEILSN